MSLLPEDAVQALRVRRSLFAAGGGLVLTLIVLVAAEYRMMRLAPASLTALLLVFWAGNLILLGVIRSGINLRFNDPSLTRIQILWGILWVMLLTYYLDDARPAALMTGLLIINFGAFRLNLAELATVSAIALAGYAMVIYLLRRYHPDIFEFHIELFVLAGFATALFGTTLVGHGMFTLRRVVQDRNRKLEDALEKMNQLAVTDDLTGAYNRRYLLEMLGKQKALADRGGYAFSICFFDLDNFKRINDDMGHAAGDAVLKKTAEITMQIIRKADYLARYGGEEFVVVLVTTEKENAVVAAERIRATLEAEDFGDLAPDLRITVSLGVTAFRRGEEVEATIARADDAMYQAKRKGRNAVVSV